MKISIRWNLEIKRMIGCGLHSVWVEVRLCSFQFGKKLLVNPYLSVLLSTAISWPGEEICIILWTFMLFCVTHWCFFWSVVDIGVVLFGYVGAVCVRHGHAVSIVCCCCIAISRRAEFSCVSCNGVVYSCHWQLYGPARETFVGLQTVLVLMICYSTWP